MDKIPINSLLARCLSCHSPNHMADFLEKCENLFAKISEKLDLCKRTSGKEAYSAKQEYSSFLRITMKRKKNNFIQFRKKDDRVDTFLWKYISETGKYDNLGKIFKLLLILFQAQVKHGFSVNSNILVENLHEHSLIAQRLVNDYMRSQNLQPYELPTTKKVLTNVKNVRSR